MACKKQEAIDLAATMFQGALDSQDSCGEEYTPAALILPHLKDHTEEWREELAEVDDQAK
jgi:hypothetical protein